MNRISLLGPLSVVIDGQARPISAPKQRAVLAQLALEPGLALSADRLLEAVWGEQRPAGGAKAVAFQITKLRDALEPDRVGEGTVILTAPAGYVLDLEPRQIDLHDFASVVDDAGRAIVDDAIKAQFLAEDALAMWRGTPFADVPGSLVIDEEARRLVLLHERAQRVLFEARIEQGGHDEVVADITRFVDRHPLDESGAALLMRALDRGGRAADALRVFSALRERLVEELGIDPSPELAELELQILSRERTPAPPSPAVARPETASLPRPVTSLVGRDRDVEAVLDRLVDGSCRVLTLLGPGGIGKSRLAIEVAHRWKPSDGWARFVPLAEVDGGGIVDVVAGAVGLVVDQHITFSGLPARTQLLDYLASEGGLLVLDNYEHLLHHADLVSEIARTCPDVTVLVTSRERLNVPAEWLHQVEGLTVHGPEAAANRLFVTRSQQAGATLEPGDREHITRLCSIADGLPLAIELAAAATPYMSVAEIADRLASNAASLEADSGSVDDRHRSLQAAFDSSWSMLDSALQSMLVRLSVFGAPFTAEAAERVAGVGRSGLARLQMKSLLRRSGTVRFDLHPLVRQFAVGRLGDDVESARRSHADYYVDVLARLTPLMEGGPEQMAAVARTDDEIDNIRTAAAWLAANADDPILDRSLCHVLRGLEAYYFVRSFTTWATATRSIADTVERSLGTDRALATESYRWARVHHSYPDSMFGGVDVAVAVRSLRPHLVDMDPAAMAWCLTSLAVCAESEGDIELALELMQEAAALPCEGDPALDAVVMSWLGWELHLLGRSDEAGEVWKRGLATAEAAQNQTGRAYLLSKVGVWADDTGESEIAIQCHRESAALFEQTGDQGGLGYTLSRLSWSYRQLGEYEVALRYAEEGLERFRRVNHRWGIGASLGRIGHVHLERGDLPAAALGFRECLDWGDQASMPAIVCYGLLGIGMTLAAGGDDLRAVVLLAHNVTIDQNPYTPVHGRSALEAASERLDPNARDSASERGCAMDMTEAIMFARRCAEELGADADADATVS